jgi:predicted Zn-dependent peptidase
MTVYLRRNPAAPAVAVNLWYRVGAADDPPGRSGFAHMFEHLMFRGSKHVADGQFDRLLNRAGRSEWDATTDMDRTNYYETVPANQLELVLWLESDRMGFLLDAIDEARFKAEREVVKNEYRQSFENEAYGLVMKYIRQHMYPTSHPYHRVTIGEPAQLDAASLDDVRAFFVAHYAPNNATLVLDGDIEPESALALVKKYFEPIPRRAVPTRPPAPAAPVLPGEVRLRVEAGVEQRRVYVSWPTPPALSREDGVLDVLANALAHGTASRLSSRLVTETKKAVSVSAGQGSMQLGSQFEIVATARPGVTCDELLAAIDEEVARVQKEPISDAELKRARNVALSYVLFPLDKAWRRADAMNHYVHHTGRVDFLADDMARYERATSEDVRAVAEKYLPRNARVVVFVEPTPGAPTAGRLAGEGTRRQP